MKHIKRMVVLLGLMALAALLIGCASNGAGDEPYYRPVETTENTVAVYEQGNEIVRVVTNVGVTETLTFTMDGDNVTGARQERVYVETAEAEALAETMNAQFSEAEKEKLNIELNGNVLTCSLLESDYNVYNVFGNRADLMAFLVSQYSDYGYRDVSAEH